MGVLLAGLWCFARDVAPGRWTAPRLAAFLVLGALAALRGLWNAQSNALAVGLMLLAASAAARALAAVGSGPVADARRRRRWWRAAALLAAAVCLKLTPLAPALLLCALWPRRLAWRFAVATAVGFLLPFLTRPAPVVLQHYEDWLVHLMTSGGDRWEGFRDAWTVWLAVCHVADGLPGRLAVCHRIDTSAYRAVQVAAALAALAWCLWQRRAARRDAGSSWPVHAALCVGMAWLMLFGPAIEHATYVFLAAPLAWAVVQRSEWPAGRGVIAAAAVFILVLGWGAVARAAEDPWPGGGSLLVASLPLGTALFTLWLAGYAVACRPGPLRPVLTSTDEDARPLDWDDPAGRAAPATIGHGSTVYSGPGLVTERSAPELR
jgi:hypothetical protein